VQMRLLRAIQVLVLLVGVGIGAYHLFFASLAIFVFRDSEPWTSWAAVLLGPGATLIGVVVSFFSPRIGGVGLLTSATLALLSFMLGEAGDVEHVRAFALGVTLPMAALGAATLAISRRRNVLATASQ